MSCGIYKIQNLINHKIYIGQSINIQDRWKSHILAKDELPLHNAIHQYGISSFSFNIVQLCSNEDLNKKEKFYIQKYNSLMPNGYNLTMGGSPSFINKTNKVAVQQYSLLGNFIQEYNSITEASYKTNICLANISQCILGKVKQAGGYQWKRKNDTKQIASIVNDTVIFGILQFSLNGKFIKQYNTATEAGLAVHRQITAITNACKGKTKKCAGYQWRYKIPGEEIKNIDPI